jgi:protein transport protein SEC24
MTNECPPHYQSQLDASGYRVDRNHRAELCLASVEFVAPPSYLIRPCSPMAVVFCIEISHATLSTGVFKATLQAIRNSLAPYQATTEGMGCAGILTYGKELSFYDLHPSRTHPAVAYTNDIDDSFCPLSPEQFAPSLAKSIHAKLNSK